MKRLLMMPFELKRLAKKKQRASIQGTYVQEVIIICGVTLILYVLYALVIYGTDVEVVMHYSSSLSENDIHGTIGFAGFMLASLLLYLFGFMALIIAISAFFLLMIWAQKIFFKDCIKKLILFAAMLCAMMAILSGNMMQQSRFAFTTSGGVIGDFLYSWLLAWGGNFGATALLSVFIWSATSILLGIPLFAQLYDGLILLVRPIGALFYGLVKIVDWIVITSINLITALVGSLRASVSDIYSFLVLYHSASVTLAKYRWGLHGCGENKELPKSIQQEAQQSTLEGVKKCDLPKTSYPWAHYPFRPTAERVWRGKYCFILLPNTVLNVSMNALDNQGINWWHRLTRAIAHQQQSELEYAPPSFSLFTPPAYDKDADHFIELCHKRARKLEEKLALFGIKGRVVEISPGPVITLFEYRPESTSKVSKIVALEDDLALALTALSIRIIAPIPGRDVVGFEIANQERRVVRFSEILLSPSYDQQPARLPLIFGVDVVGKPIIVDLVEMPHLLVGGTTGSGKSVGLNTMLMSLLCSKSPEQLRLILIDPKRLEFSPYADIAHLHFPIVTQADQASRVLSWLVQEMERRYELLAQRGVRNIVDYERISGEKMPFIVLMIDELADLMMVAAKEVETSITRLAQMARAAGIHIIVATQRPSVDVVTGLIKVNFPSRVSFRVSSKIDSRTIIDRSGAEKLLGKGDMLFMHATASVLQRIHGCYLSQDDIERYTSALRLQSGPTYLNLDEEMHHTQDKIVERDELYENVVDFIQTTGEVSISLLQRQYRIGFNRSARIIEQLEMDGLIAPMQGSKPRKVIR